MRGRSQLVLAILAIQSHSGYLPTQETATWLLQVGGLEYFRRQPLYMHLDGSVHKNRGGGNAAAQALFFACAGAQKASCQESSAERWEACQAAFRCVILTAEGPEKTLYIRTIHGDVSPLGRTKRQVQRYLISVFLQPAYRHHVKSARAFV